MRTCYYLPGLLGSSLARGGGTGTVVWADLTILALGGLVKLRLASDGLAPYPGSGEALKPVKPLSDYYGETENVLRADLAPHDYEVVPFAYDFRLQMRLAGNDLANLIRGKATAADPCSIVAHSQGGLVARCAWSSLVGSGEENLCRRIVTCGTPHVGAYSAAKTLFAEDELITQLDLANGAIGVIDPLTFLIPYTRVNRDYIAKIAASWPAIYELLPMVDEPYLDGYDPPRTTLYDAANYPATTEVSQAWLDYARNNWQPFLRSSASTPPAWVMTTCAGKGIPTSSKMKPSVGKPGTSAVLDDADGDGLVDTISAWWPPGPGYGRFSYHATLFQNYDDNGFLAGLVLEERSPPAPPPPPPPPGANAIFLPGALGLPLQGPPFAWSNYGGVGPIDC